MDQRHLHFDKAGQGLLNIMAMPTSSIVTIQEAVTLLKNGEVVAIPTETVYGLAAVISDESALKKIFMTKSRPFFDPLIVHVNSISQAKEYALSWTPAHDLLATAFWPGPLTLVVEKKNVSDLITAGLPTVGLRVPAHKLAQEIIEKLGAPVAAPSANKFGKTSPTQAQHIIEEYSGAVKVVDGGSCTVGIESTILRLEELESKITVHILRSGRILPSAISETLKPLGKPIEFSRNIKKIEAPGQVEHHYMPPIPIVFISKVDEFHLEDFQKSYPHFKRINRLELPDDPAIAARLLYSKFRELSMGADAILFYKRERFFGEDWEGIIDRLWRASSLRL